MSIYWFIAFLVFLVIELVTVNLVTIWFAIGAILAMLCSLITDSIVVQGVVFLVSSILVLVLTRPLMKKFKGFDRIPTNSDRVIGKIGEVTAKIEKNKYGEVKVFGNVWTATSNQVLNVGEHVKVKAIDGVKLIVEKEEE